MKPFNKEITGYKNENEFVNYLNRKKVSEVNPMFRDFLETLFGKLNNNDLIRAWNNYEKQKADIYIQINGNRKGISIKKGIKNSVHTEHISTFTKFLKKNHFSQETINNILRYHYADGTIDGSGENRITVAEYKDKHQSEIDLINKEFCDETFIRKAISKFILVGNISIDSIDCLVYGIIEDFIWITKNEIVEFLLSKKNEYSTALHISHLTIQPLTRCLNKNPIYEKDRHYIQIKWYNISDDIIEVMSKRKTKIY